MTGCRCDRLVFCICCNNHISRKREREHRRQAHNPLTNPTPRKHPRLAFQAAHTPRDKAKPASKPLERQDMHTTDHCLDMSPILDLELPASPTSDGETHHHLEDSGQGDSLLVTCMSQRWHNGCYLWSESDEDSDGDDRDVEGSGKAPNVPFKDGPNNDELDVFDWDALNQEYGPTCYVATNIGLDVDPFVHVIHLQ